MPKAVSVPLRAVDPQRETESGSTVKIEVSNQITHQTGDTNKGEEILQLPSDLSAAEKIIEKMPASAFKVRLLAGVALKYDRYGNRQIAKKHLEAATAIALNLSEPTEKVTTLINIAQAYHSLNQPDTAQEQLKQATLIANGIESPQRRSELWLDLALAYDELGQSELAQQRFQDSVAALQQTLEPQARFPFKEESPDISIGISGQVNSYRDTTAYLGVNFDLYKQWEEADLTIDGSVYLDFDSSRSVNNFRPGSLSSLVYRDYFNDQWSFFNNTFVSTNQTLYSSSNNDEDLEIIAASYLGAGLNLWRGDTPRKFLDFQIGLGPRYEYSYVNFQQARNRIDPVLGLILYGRGFEVGNITINSTFYFTPVITDLNRYIIGSDSRFNIPLSERWTLSNRLFMRYQNEPVIADTPKFEFFLSTGLEYKF
jgi:tetratricopeptide (TPR) repeat protein